MVFSSVSTPNCARCTGFLEIVLPDAELCDCGSDLTLVDSSLGECRGAAADIEAEAGSQAANMHGGPESRSLGTHTLILLPRPNVRWRGERTLCTVVLNVPAVSREHAVIRRIQDKFYIEDMKSRNGTFVNNKEVTTRTLLKDNDKIKICDNILAFFESAPRAPLPPDLNNTATQVEEEEEDSSTVEASSSSSSGGASILLIS